MVEEVEVLLGPDDGRHRGNIKTKPGMSVISYSFGCASGGPEWYSQHAPYRRDHRDEVGVVHLGKLHGGDFGLRALRSRIAVMAMVFQ